MNFIEIWVFTDIFVRKIKLYFKENPSYLFIYIYLTLYVQDIQFYKTSTLEARSLSTAIDTIWCPGTIARPKTRGSSTDSSSRKKMLQWSVLQFTQW